MSLLVDGRVTSHSGLLLDFKIECDALSEQDWDTLALIVARRIVFKEAHGVPRGGLPFAAALQKYRREFGKVLVVDDVATTGKSLEAERDRVGADMAIVAFGRGPLPDWVYPIFTLEPWAR